LRPPEFPPGQAGPGALSDVNQYSVLQIVILGVSVLETRAATGLDEHQARR